MSKKGGSRFTLDEEEVQQLNPADAPADDPPANGAADEEAIAPRADGDTAPPPPPPQGVWKYLPQPMLAAAAFGIIGSLMVYAYLQERIMTGEYSTPGSDEKGIFKDSVFLVMMNRIAAGLVAAGVLLVRGETAELKPRAPIYKFFMVSGSNVIATYCQYEALKYVTFPTQTLFKCGKMIPVMIWGTFLHRKTYGVVDYSVAAMVAVGCTIFLTSGNVKAKRADASDSWYGLALMAGYLGFDGFTSTFQETLFAGYQMTIYNQMMYVNMCSATFSLVVLLASQRLFAALEFVLKYPQFIVDAVVLSFSAVAGQFCITYTIKTFGALAYATIMTIRQFLSVFVSNILFAHGMSALQWLGAITVFGSLFFKSWHKSVNSGR
mmetsp:Transcript_52985/g.129941  ORF Transcript_52985/g.129941 Transcript_52985/m.129941 type:complete len:379 (+) Transcript_52985:213-1349(+)